MPPSQSYKRRRVACQHFPDDQTLRLQTGAGEDDIIHLPSGLDHADCERQEEEEPKYIEVFLRKACKLKSDLLQVLLNMILLQRKAISKVQATGGLEKTDPNAVRKPTPDVETVKKRVLENIGKLKDRIMFADNWYQCQITHLCKEIWIYAMICFTFLKGWQSFFQLLLLGQRHVCKSCGIYTSSVWKERGSYTYKHPFQGFPTRLVHLNYISL